MSKLKWYFGLDVAQVNCSSLPSNSTYGMFRIPIVLKLCEGTERNWRIPDIVCFLLYFFDFGNRMHVGPTTGLTKRMNA